MKLPAYAAGAAVLLTTTVAEAGAVFGRVLDARGRVPPSVQIEVVARDATGRRGEHFGLDSKRLVGTSAADGSFRIQLPPDWPASEILVSTPGSVRLRAADVVTGADDLDLGSLTLTPAQVLTGVVLDEAGHPIAGARVKALSAVSIDGQGDLLPGESATDVAGRYLIVDAPERVAQMMVTHSHYVSQLAPRTKSSWMLKEGGTIEGVVVDDHGRPVTNARVRAADHSELSDRSGAFRLEGLAPGLTHVNASDDDGGVAHAEILVVDHDSVSATLSLQPGTIVRGTIRDVTGRPVPWTSIRVYQAASHSLGPQHETSTIANGAGEFRITGLEPAQYILEAQRSGYLRAIQALAVTRSSRSVDMFLLMHGEARIEGRVTDNANQPIAGARVSVNESNPIQELARQLRAGRPEAATTYSDRAGNFVLRGLWPGRALRVEAAAKGLVTARLDGIELAAGATRSGIKLQLHAGTMATGLVTDQQDHPIADVEVYSTRIDESAAMPLAGGILQPPGGAAAHTDGEGRYTLAGLEQGRYYHTFVRDGFSRGFIPSTQVIAGTINELPPIKLSRAAAIAGRVVDQRQRPVPGASIYAIDRRLEVVAAISDSNGEFAVTNLSQGDEVSLQVESEQAPPGQLKVRAPASGVTIQLSEALTLRGRVYDTITMNPITDFSVERIVRVPGTTTIHFGGPAARQFHADDGAFELNRLSPGPCVLRVRSSGYLAADIAVPSVQTAGDVAVPLARGISLAGRVLLAGSREPVPNVTVTWRQGDAARAELEAMFASLATAEDAAVTDGDGRFVLEGVPTGTVTLFGAHAEYASTRMNITVPTRSAVELILTAGGTLAGVVLLDNGGPAAGATVAVTPAGERNSMAPPDTATTDSSGRFRFARLRDGSYAIVARAPTGASAPNTVVIAASERHDDLVLTLRGGTTIRGSVRSLQRDAQSNVFVMAHAEGYYDSTFTDSAGTFSLPHVPPGMVALEATTSFRQGLTAGTRLEISENGPPTVDVDIDFGGQSELSGIIFRGGRPVPSLSVTATPVLPNVTTRGRAESLADGSYRIEGLTDGQYQLVFTGAFGLYRRVADVRGSTRLDVDLPSGSIAGIVVDALSQETIPEAVVTAIAVGERTIAEAKRTVTDARGYYTIAELDPGTYQVRATRSGYQQEARIITIHESEQRVDLDLQRHSSIRLRVTDRTNGAPISRAVVRLTSRGIPAFIDTLSLDNNGRAELPSPVPGDYVLTVLVAGYAPHSVVMQVPTPPIDVLVEPGGRVQVRLSPATSTRVRLVDPAGIAQALPGADPSGWTAISGVTTVWPNVAAGSYRLEAMSGRAAAVIVKSGTTSVVEIQ